MNSTPKAPLQSVNDHLSNAEHLRGLRERADFLRNITSRLSEALGPPLADRFAVARCDPTQIVIVAQSSAWATRLRFTVPEIATFFAEYFSHSRAPRVDIRVARQENTRPATTEPALSGNAAHKLKQQARQTSDPRLAKTLLRIASRVSANSVKGDT